MKKSLIIISAGILTLSVALTSCGKSGMITDTNGKTHMLITEKGGSVKQDPWGNLYEEVTDSDGNTVTQAYAFPNVSSNKSGSKAENAVISIEVPNHWKLSSGSTVLRLRHSGECTDVDEPPCQLDFSYNSNLSLQETYDAYKAQVRGVEAYNSNVSNITEYDTTLFGLDAKAISYHIDNADSTVYYFCVHKGVSNIEIIANIYAKCYDKDSIAELINSCCTLKELGTVTPPAEATTEEASSSSESDAN